MNLIGGEPLNSYANLFTSVFAILKNLDQYILHSRQTIFVFYHQFANLILKDLILENSIFLT